MHNIETLTPLQLNQNNKKYKKKPSLSLRTHQINKIY